MALWRDRLAGKQLLLVLDDAVGSVAILITTASDQERLRCRHHTLLAGLGGRQVGRALGRNDHLAIERGND
jgi:hypothetical protein